MLLFIDEGSAAIGNKGFIRVTMKFSTKNLFQPSFLICVLVLAAAGVSKKAVIKLTGAQLVKLPIELKKPLDLLDEEALGPYKVIKKGKIEDKDVLDSLGTEEYIDWTLEDTEAPPSSPTKYCSVFITYYTGNPNAVPHVPEECFVGGGYQEISSERGILKMNIEQSPATGSGESRQLQARYLVFAPKNSGMWGGPSKFARMYFFKANDDFTSNRTETRKVMGKNLFGKYAYFSKVEWQFFGERRGNAGVLDKEQATRESEKLMSVLVVALERDHWPQWQ